jgi:hypothetical protein
VKPSPAAPYSQQPTLHRPQPTRREQGLNRSRVSTPPAQPPGPLPPAHRAASVHHHHHPDPGLHPDCVATDTPPAAAPAARTTDHGYHHPQTTAWWLGPLPPRSGLLAVVARRAGAVGGSGSAREGRPWNRPGERPEGLLRFFRGCFFKMGRISLPDLCTNQECTHPFDMSTKIF